MLLVLALLAYGGLPSNPPVPVAHHGGLVVAVEGSMPGERFIAPTQVREYRSRVSLAGLEDGGDAPKPLAPVISVVPPDVDGLPATRPAPEPLHSSWSATYKSPRAPPVRA